MIKVIKEAVIGEYHFILDPKYFAVVLDKDEKVLISREELSDLVGWLNSETGVVSIDKCPCREQGGKSHYEPKYSSAQRASWACPREEVVIDRANDEMSNRSATQTVPLHVGDPNLAYQHTAGVQEAVQVDLVLEASRAGATVHTKS